MSSLNDNKKKSEYVKLNVGGMLFQTTISTLTKFEENMLAAMFSGRMERTIDEEGWVLIDRSGKHFGVILNFLRDGTVPLPSVKVDLAELRAEANFFCISELVALCDQALVVPINIHDIGPSTFIVLAKPLEMKVIESLTKPTIILEITDNFYPASKNHVDFFEQLATDFHENILFIRYQAPINNTFFRWYFYANGKESNTTFSDSEDVPKYDIQNNLAKLFQSFVPKL